MTENPWYDPMSTPLPFHRKPRGRVEALIALFPARVGGGTSATRARSRSMRIAASAVALVAALALVTIPRALAMPTASKTPRSGEELLIDRWIAERGLNEYGDPKDTMYAGGNPLFDESTGETADRVEYIAAAHPDRPWLTEEPDDLPEDAEATDEQGRFPKHWGPEPPIQTRDYRELPGGYGFGSSTLYAWIENNMAKDAAAAAAAAPPAESPDLR